LLYTEKSRIIRGSGRSKYDKKTGVFPDRAAFSCIPPIPDRFSGSIRSDLQFFPFPCLTPEMKHFEISDTEIKDVF